MIKITDYLPADKLLHLQGGLIIAMVVTPLSDPVVGLCAALGVGAFKEWIWDGWMTLGNVEGNDFYATAGGGVLGSALGYGLPLIGKIV